EGETAGGRYEELSGAVLFWLASDVWRLSDTKGKDMASQTRAAFVGSGNIAESHLSGLSKHSDVQLVAFCDVNRTRAEEVAARYGAQAFTDAGEMMDATAPEAVYFCLPPFAHGAELQAVERGIPFFVEKPVALDT